MRSIFNFAALLLIVTLQTGCASIVSGQNQSVSVTAKTETADLDGAKCTLQNDKGQWFVTTPGSVMVRRAYGEMAVNCSHGELNGLTMAQSSTKAMAFGNIIFGGIIGAGVDIGTGAAYDYPSIISVDMRNIPPTPMTLKPAVAAGTGRFAAEANKKAAAMGCVATSMLVGSAGDEERYSNQCNNIAVSLRCDARGCSE